ncbi:unnamed protein product [Meganyctiphanes norvegica]|uniref:Proton-coupled folate transporter n=1 Tax=Meganyctiphanes norvegica TaxID=48144 RepID=A0AAV2R7X4_MEGNR
MRGDDDATVTKEQHLMNDNTSEVSNDFNTVTVDDDDLSHIVIKEHDNTNDNTSESSEGCNDDETLAADDDLADLVTQEQQIRNDNTSEICNNDYTLTADDDLVPLVTEEHHYENENTSESPNYCFDMLTKFCSYVTIEPSMFLIALGYSFEGVFVDNLWIDKVCLIQLNYSKEICKNLDSGNYNSQQDNVQRWVKSYSMYSQIIETIPVLFAIILLGAWSDTRGRKLPYIIPQFGYLLKVFSYIINAYFWFLPPWCLLIVEFPYGLCGSMIGMFLAAYAYLADSTGQRSRTSRFSVLAVMFEVAMPIGKYAGVIIYDKFGYIGVFGIGLICNILSIIYSFVFLKNIISHSSGEENNETIDFKKLFSTTKIKNQMSVCFKQRENNERARLLGNVAVILLSLLTFGEDTYLYTRKKFGWNYKDYTLFSIASTPVLLFASLVVLPIMSYRLGFEDNLIGFISSCTAMFSNVIKGTAPYGWVLYIAIGILIFGTSVSTSTRSALTKFVPSNEIGSIYATLAIFETLLPLITEPIETFVYNASLDIFPGMIFLLGAVFYLLISCILVWLLTHFPPERNHINP